MPSASPALRIVPANEASWEDLQAIFGTRGAASVLVPALQAASRARPSASSRSRSAPSGSASRPSAGFPERRRPAASSPTWTASPSAGAPSSHVRPTPGCAQQPGPWIGRTEDKADATVWAVTCLFTRAGFRKRGISRALALAAVDFARDRGARALEAYPINTTDVIAEELHVGTVPTFADAGLTEVSRPTLRRVVMRIDF